MIGMRIGYGRTDQQVDLSMPSQCAMQRRTAPVRSGRQLPVREPQKGDRLPPNAQAA